MITVFIDTQFTTLDTRAGEPRLISIGQIAEDGRQFYAELTDTWAERDCSDFVTHNVLPLLQGGIFRMTEAQLAARLKGWIEDLTDSEVELRSDSPAFDWPWISSLFDAHAWPGNLIRKCENIQLEDEDQWRRFEEGVRDFWKVYVHKPHHSLTDAKSLVSGWWYAQANEMGDTQFANLLNAFMQFGLNDGDIGYSYWWGMRQKLQELRNRR